MKLLFDDDTFDAPNQVTVEKTQETEMGNYKYRADGRKDFNKTIAKDCTNEKKIMYNIVKLFTSYDENDIFSCVSCSGFEMRNHKWVDNSNNFANHADGYIYFQVKEGNYLIKKRLLVEIKAKPEKYPSSKWLHIKEDCVGSIKKNRASVICVYSQQTNNERFLFFTPQETCDMLDNAKFEKHRSYRSKLVTCIYDDNPYSSNALVYTDKSSNKEDDVLAIMKTMIDASEEVDRYSLI